MKSAQFELCFSMMIRCLCALFVGSCWMLSQPNAADRLAPLYFLLGEWTGTGHGEPGTGSGGFTFEKDLDGRILVRRSRAVYPPTAGRPASVHEDLTVVYSSPDGLRASYFDNEGNQIQYRVEVVADQGTVTFLSDKEPGAPRFRLIYRKEADQVRVTFQIAPPGQPEAFKTYMEGTVARSSSRGK